MFLFVFLINDSLFCDVLVVYKGVQVGRYEDVVIQYNKDDRYIYQFILNTFIKIIISNKVVDKQNQI